MATLNCVKPGAKQGQIILLVDLTKSGNPDRTLGILKGLGYEPEIRHIEFREGAHVCAVLRDECLGIIPQDYLEPEWMQLQEVITPEAVHLWIGK